MNEELNQQVNKLDELAWIAEARSHLGLTETKGARHNPVIKQWLEELGAWWEDDETPWCGVFVAWCAKKGGRDLPQHWYRALAWADAGTVLDRPAYGAVAVMERKGGGHVGFVVGQADDDNILLIGGNQNNQVSIAKFPKSRIKSYIWLSKNGEKRLPDPSRYALQKLDFAGGFSQNEA